MDIAATAARDITFVDVDGDGDVDLLSAAPLLNTFIWYENSNGDATLWASHEISSNVIFPANVEAADINGDGNMDVLVGSPTQDELIWYDNLAGDGSTWGVQSISDDLDLLSKLYVADIDGDGDVDALTSAGPPSYVSWHENLVGNGSSWSQHFILDSGRSLPADIDGDGDIDVVTCTTGGLEMAWLENEFGNGSTWVSHTISFVPGVAFAADLNEDGDCDLVTASFTQGSILVFDNAFGDGSLWTVSTVTDSAPSTGSVFAADLDGDSDLDILSSATFPVNEISWHENLTPSIFIGSSVNPAGSLTVLSGEPSIGTDIVLGIDNPLGTQTAGALPLLVVTNTPDPQFPAGTLIPGYGMEGAFGELLVSLNPVDLITSLAGAPWAGAGSPSPIAISIPADPLLIGFRAYLQGVLLDTSGSTLKAGLTATVEMTLQP